MTSELLEGHAQVTEALSLSKVSDRKTLSTWLSKWNQAHDKESRIAIALDPQLGRLMDQHEHRAAWTL